MPGRKWVCRFALLFVALPAFAIKPKSINDGVTQDQIAAILGGPGATITNIRITGSNLAIGSFTEGDALGIANGVVLSTGNIADAVGPNNSEGAGAGLGTVGAPALDAIVKPFTTNDAITMEFDVVTESPTFAIRYVFASEEYREYVDDVYNDVFAFFVNGANIALTPGTGQPVTINTINHLRNQAIYQDNEGGTDTQFDGYTTPLLAVAIVEPGIVNHVRISIADTSDSVLDSAVFIAQGGISGSQLAPLVIPREASIEAFFGEQGNVVQLPLFYAFENRPPTLSATGIPGATITFTPLYHDSTGQIYSNMNIVLGPDTPSGAHIVTIRSAVGAAESFATIVVIVECQPPAILGIGQPLTQVVDRGTTATFHVQPQGSFPRFQWYQGFTGMTRVPVPSDANGDLRVVVDEITPYWVRVTNPCGSYDSLTAFAIPR